MAKKNCWEFKDCGREVGGINSKELGLCPAAMEVRLDGIHAGKNAGRACWVVAGTFCTGKVQGTFAEKYNDCMKCDFYQKVMEEEDIHFEFSSALINKLGSPA